MSFTSFSRRKLLASIAAAGGASRLSPFVPASVFAAEAPKRILTVFHPMGYLEREFFPVGTGADFTLGASLKALDPWRQKLVFIDGLTMCGAQYYFNFPSNEHGLGGALAFTGGKYVSDAFGVDSPSVDQAIADFQYNQVKTQFRSLNLGVNARGGIFYSKAGTPVRALNNPQEAFDQLFRGFAGPTAPPSGGAPSVPAPGTGPAPGMDTSARDRQLKREQSILNLVKGDLGRVRALAGKEDQSKLDTHLAGISSLENRLKLIGGGSATTTTPKPTGTTPSAPPVAAGSVTAGCAKPTLPSGPIDASVHAQMDLIAAAFACDMTRSASLQLGDPNGGVDAVPGVNHHDTTHSISPGVSPATLDNHKKFDLWFAARWAYLLNKLDSIKEGNGSLLDNTLVLFASDTFSAQGQDAGGDFGAHGTFRIPMWMAGGGAFAFKTGQAIKIAGLRRTGGSKTTLHKEWVAHHRLLTSICQSFGMPVDSFGGNDPGKGGMPELTRA